VAQRNNLILSLSKDAHRRSNLLQAVARQADTCPSFSGLRTRAENHHRSDRQLQKPDYPSIALRIDDLLPSDKTRGAGIGVTWPRKKEDAISQR